MCVPLRTAVSTCEPLHSSRYGLKRQLAFLVARVTSTHPVAGPQGWGGARRERTGFCYACGDANQSLCVMYGGSSCPENVRCAARSPRPVTLFPTPTSTPSVVSCPTCRACAISCPTAMYVALTYAPAA